MSLLHCALQKKSVQNDELVEGMDTLANFKNAIQHTFNGLPIIVAITAGRREFCIIVMCLPHVNVLIL